ncbi:MAG TPA: CHAD domain-containing protein [Roseomonas sp.]|jgi:CHAD domain-containing protein
MSARAGTEMPIPDATPVAAPEPPAPPPFTIELALPVEAAARLTRLPVVAARRLARSRGGNETLLWFDTPQGTLAAAGLALEQRARGVRQLLVTLPPAGTFWHPGLPPLPSSDPMPEAAEAGPLVAQAAFHGRKLSFALSDPAGEVEAVLLNGKLRAVADEHPVARLALSGPVPAVLAVAREIAAEVPALPPAHALAEQARAIAQGDTPRLRRRGAPDPVDAATVEDALALAIGHLAEAVLALAPGARADAGPEAVHQMRVGLRRMRSVLKLFRKAADGPAPKALEAGLKVLLGYLGPARDWDVFTLGIGRAIGEAMPEERAVAALLEAAEARRQAAYAALERFLASADYRLLAWELTGFVAARRWRDEASEEALALLATPLPSFAETLLEKRWHGLAEDGAAMAEMDDGRLHEMRLDAKRLRYTAELFAPLWPGRRSRRFLKRLAEVQEALGLANDAVVAGALAASLANGKADRAYAIGIVTGWARARVGKVRREATETWEALDAAGTFW